MSEPMSHQPLLLVERLKQRWRYVLYQSTERYFLSVTCASVGVKRIDVELNESEIQRLLQDGRVYIDDLAHQLSQNPKSHSKRHIEGMYLWPIEYAPSVSSDLFPLRCVWRLSMPSQNPMLRGHSHVELDGDGRLFLASAVGEGSKLMASHHDEGFNYLWSLLKLAGFPDQKITRKTCFPGEGSHFIGVYWEQMQCELDFPLGVSLSSEWEAVFSFCRGVLSSGQEQAD